MKIPRFEFPGLYGRRARCGLERIDLSDGRVLIIATELPNNPGVSITNFAEDLAIIVCRRLVIDPTKLVWIEHYPAQDCPVCDGTRRKRHAKLKCRACDGTGKRRETPTYDLVTFRSSNNWYGTVFTDPQWRPMQVRDWRNLGLEPR
jgi:hypothetical protein